MAEGFSLHAGIAIDERDRDSLERLARDYARPPLAKILAHLGHPTQVSSQSPARVPPHVTESMGWGEQDGIDPIPLS